MTDDTEACMGNGDLGEVLAQSLTDLSKDCILHEPVEQVAHTEDAYGAHLARVRYCGPAVGVGGLAQAARDGRGVPQTVGFTLVEPAAHMVIQGRRHGEGHRTTTVTRTACGSRHPNGSARRS